MLFISVLDDHFSDCCTWCHEKRSFQRIPTSFFSFLHPSLLSSHRPSFLPSYLPSLLPFNLPSFLFSFLPPFLFLGNDSLNIHFFHSSTEFNNRNQWQSPHYRLRHHASPTRHGVCRKTSQFGRAFAKRGRCSRRLTSTPNRQKNIEKQSTSLSSVTKMSTWPATSLLTMDTRCRLDGPRGGWKAKSKC